MAGKMSQLFREYIMGISIILAVIGVIVTTIGAVCTFEMGFFTSDIEVWGFYILVIGVIILLSGIYYFYDYISNKRFFMEEIHTNKRSEFVKRHQDLKNAVKHLPSKYQTILKDKEKEFKIH